MERNNVFNVNTINNIFKYIFLYYNVSAPTQKHTHTHTHTHIYIYIY